MAKKIKIEVTAVQLRAICEIVEDISAMIGCAENEVGEINQDAVWKKQIKQINKMFDDNGIKH